MTRYASQKITLVSSYVKNLIRKILFIKAISDKKKILDDFTVIIGLHICLDAMHSVSFILVLSINVMTPETSYSFNCIIVNFIDKIYLINICEATAANFLAHLCPRSENLYLGRV